MIKNKKLYFIIIIFALILCTGYFSFVFIRNQSIPTSSSEYSSGGDRTQSSSNSSSQGGATDLGGALPKDAGSSAPSSLGTSSSSGEIFLNMPISGATIKSGSAIAGTSYLGSIQYRLVDSSIGVLAQGDLNVVDGRFSGILHFTPQSTKGELVIFSYDPSGSETNSIRIQLALGK